MSRLRTSNTNASEPPNTAPPAPVWTPDPLPPAGPRKSAPNGGPPTASKRTTWLLLAGWALVSVVIYWATEGYRKPAEGKVTAHGVLEIPRGSDGHFRVNGAVNGVPVQFMVDTGASIISITDKVADRAQLPEGVPISFQTANGVREGTMRRADRVEVGTFAVNNLRVGTGYTGESDKDALLGQNFLRYFDVTMAGNTMRLKPRDTEEMQ